MKHIIFSIHDSKAAAYLPPFIMHRTEMAVRVFTDCINDDKHQFAKNPADYTLFTIGTFDDNTAKIKTEKMVHSLGNGIEFLQMKTLDEGFPALEDGEQSPNWFEKEQAKQQDN